MPETPSTNFKPSSYFTPAREAPARPSSPLLSSPRQRKTMSITQTYYLAHKARAKLSRQAAQSDHDLRLLVGHANLLDSLMLDLAEAEREQESWFNQSVRGNSSHEDGKRREHQDHQKSQHIRWADATVLEEDEEDYNDYASSVSSDDTDSCSSESSSEDEYEYDEATESNIKMADAVPFSRITSYSGNASSKLPMTTILGAGHGSIAAVAEVGVEDDEEDEDLALTRTPSHPYSHSHPNSPPELAHDDEDSSEDEVIMPPSPQNPPVHELSEQERKTIVTTGYYGIQDDGASLHGPTNRSSFYSHGYCIPPANAEITTTKARTGSGTLVSAISVY